MPPSRSRHRRQWTRRPDTHEDEPDELSPHHLVQIFLNVKIKGWLIPT